MLDDRQTQASAASFAGAGAIDPIEPLENPFAGFGRNPRTIILHPEFGFLFSEQPASNANMSFVPPVFKSVLDEVEQDLMQPVGIGLSGQAGRQQILERRLFFGGAG